MAPFFIPTLFFVLCALFLKKRVEIREQREEIKILYSIIYNLYSLISTLKISSGNFKPLPPPLPSHPEPYALITLRYPALGS